MPSAACTRNLHILISMMWI